MLAGRTQEAMRALKAAWALRHMRMLVMCVGCVKGTQVTITPGTSPALVMK